MLNNATLTRTEISSMIADFAGVIELAVLDVAEYQPTAIFDQIEDMISTATIAVMVSLRTFKRRFLSIANVVAWVRKAARWSTMNQVKRLANGNRKVRALGTLASVAAPAPDARAQDAARLSAALDVLTKESRTVLVSIMGGQKASDVAKRLGLSNATITRRKQEAMTSVATAMAA